MTTLGITSDSFFPHISNPKGGTDAWQGEQNGNTGQELTSLQSIDKSSAGDEHQGINCYGTSNKCTVGGVQGRNWSELHMGAKMAKIKLQPQNASVKQGMQGMMKAHNKSTSEQ